jgi:hypothetical protein
MRHRSYPEFHIPATEVSDKDTQEFLDAAGSVARFPSSPPPSLAIGAYPGVTPGANLPEGLSLAPEPEALPLEDHLRQALRISHQRFRRCYNSGTYASSEYVFLALAKSHPELRDADRSEAFVRIADALDCPLEEIDEIGMSMSTASKAQDVDYMDLGKLIGRNWDAIERAILPPVPDETNLMTQALRKMQDQPVVSRDCPDGSDRYHQLLSIAYWVSVFSGGTFGLEQNLLAKILDCSQRTVSSHIATARREGHLTLSPDGPQTPSEAKRKRRTYEYEWATDLPGGLLSRRVHKKEVGDAHVRGSEGAGRRGEEGQRNRPSVSGSASALSDKEFLARFARVRSRGKKQWRARCPSHDDEHPSLDILITEEVRCLNCWAGCATEDVLEAAGLTWRDLFVGKERR